MKLSVAALILSSLVVPTSAQAACLDLDNLEFPSSCSFVDIEAKIAAALVGVGCSHTARIEMRLLTNTNSYGIAKQLLQAECRAGVQMTVPCTQWKDRVLDSCTLQEVKGEIEQQLSQVTCNHGAAKELELLTGTRNPNQAMQYIKAICGEAWLAVDQSTFQNDVDPRFTTSFMNQYTDGLTFLNLETGNFQGDDNPNYPTAGSPARATGANIAAFRGDGANNSVLQRTPTLNGCENQAIMCCFGRDRQVDNDGNCSNDSCDNADPADNSNLCHIDGIPFPEAEEGAIHCHGLAWSSETNDATAQLKYNNWFYVSLYDHMYKRGYVEQLLAGNPTAIAKLGDTPLPPMCGCIEDMPVVTRSDCTEIDATQNFKFNLDADMLLVAAPEGELNVNFNACNGIDYDDGTAANNDLASYVNVLHRDGKLSDQTRINIFEKLVGYAEPGNNANEAACAASVAGLI